MRVINRKRHQRGGLVARVPEHQPLIARALVHVLLGRPIDAARDIGRLPSIASHDRAAHGIKAQLGVVVSDAMDGVAGNARIIVLVIGGDLAGHDHQPGRHQRFRRHPGVRILR